MQAFWISLKENVNCASKLTDVVIWQKKHREKRSCNPDKENLDGKLIHQRRKSFGEVIIRQSHAWIQFCGNANCGCKLTDVVILPEKYSEKRSCDPGKENLDGKLIHQTRNLFGEVTIRGYQTRTQFYDKLQLLCMKQWYRYRVLLEKFL